MTQSSNSSPAVKDSLFSRATLVASVVILFVVGSYLLKNGPLETGDAAPQWKLSRVNGAQDLLSMDELRGKVVLLDFWSTTCPPCLMQIPILQRIHNEFGSDVEVVGIAVGGESPTQLQHFAKQRNIEYAIVPDLRGIAATAHNVSRLPTLFVVGRNGTIIESHEGFWEQPELLQTVRKAISQ